MPNIVIATHGSLASALVETAGLIIGETDEISIFQMTAELSHDEASRTLSALVEGARTREDRLTVLVDIKGGSPFNICSELLIKHGDFTLLTGVNLPMVIQATTNPSSMGDEISAAGTQGIVHVNQLIAGTENVND